MSNARATNKPEGRATDDKRAFVESLILAMSADCGKTKNPNLPSKKSKLDVTGVPLSTEHRLLWDQEKRGKTQWMEKMQQLVESKIKRWILAESKTRSDDRGECMDKESSPCHSQSNS